MLRQLNGKVHEFIIKMYNFCISKHLFSHEWKTGIVICIPKKGGNIITPIGYRPITLLPVIGKNFETLLKKKLWDFVDRYIPDHQFGFKPKASTINPLSILTSNISMSKLKKEKTAILCLEVKKAFDSVWHKGYKNISSQQ